VQDYISQMKAVNGVIGGVQSYETGGNFTDIVLATGFSAVAGFLGSAGLSQGYA